VWGGHQLANCICNSLAVQLHEIIEKTEAAMAKSATISMRIDSQLKSETETIFQQLGMTTTEAIKIFLTADRNRKGLPFQLQVVSEQASPVEQRKKALDAIMGAYPLMTSSTEFARLKQEEIELEEQKLRQ